MTRAKIFMSGRSQAVRLPKEFRLPGKEVNVKRVGSGLLLEPTLATFGEVFRAIDAIPGKSFKRPKQPKPAKRLPVR